MAGETLPDRKYPIIITTIIITLLAAIFLVWRLMVRFRLNPKFGLSEYLMIAGVIMNTAANVVAILGAYNGEGRIDEDPFLTPGRRITAMHLIFAAQSLNVYAIFLVKLSICAYLMPLAFRRGFRAVIWMSVVIVVVCNFIIPTCSHLGECRPMAMMWNPAVKGTCWPLTVRQAGAYIQASANIVTDLVYAASPMVYLGEINLPRRTKLGIRIVFVLALLGTGLSVIKLWELHKVLNLKQDYLYGAVNLSIYSIIEVGITIIVACLPPLRKIFDKFLQKIMPDSIMARASKAIMSLPSFATITFSSSVPTRTDTTFVGDSENGEGGLAEGREKNLPQMVQVQTTWNSISDEESRAGFGADRQQPRP